jgi:hypothetical protein
MPRGLLIEMRDIQRRWVSISTQKSYFDTLEFNSRISCYVPGRVRLVKVFD